MNSYCFIARERGGDNIGGTRPRGRTTDVKSRFQIPISLSRSFNDSHAVDLFSLWFHGVLVLGLA